MGCTHMVAPTDFSYKEEVLSTYYLWCLLSGTTGQYLAAPTTFGIECYTASWVGGNSWTDMVTRLETLAVPACDWSAHR